MNVAAIDLIADNLANLPHPDQKPTASVLGKIENLRPEFAEGARIAGRRLAESVVHLLETNGYTILSNDELNALHNRAAEVDATKPVRVQCNTCHDLLFDLALTNPQLASVSGGLLREHFRSDTEHGCRCSA